MDGQPLRRHARPCAGIRKTRAMAVPDWPSGRISPLFPFLLIGPCSLAPDMDFDLFVIGAGSGGVRAARIAANHGAKVMIAEEFRVGGTCVIRGCVPKKLLVYASRFSHDFDDAAGFGWSVPTPSFDWATLIANKDREIDRLEAAYTTNLEKAGGTIVKSRAG